MLAGSLQTVRRDEIFSPKDGGELPRGTITPGGNLIMKEDKHDRTLQFLLQCKNGGDTDLFRRKGNIFFTGNRYEPPFRLSVSEKRPLIIFYRGYPRHSRFLRP
jgi:hypothetical protein